MEPITDADQLTVDVKLCVYQDLLEGDRPVVCVVHSCLLVLGAVTTALYRARR